jgi:catechol 2,3-dioxygenase-like lactoylglutathione lyase family enzyme
MLTVTAMDHIVLNVKDMDTVLDFYINVLGLSGERIDAYRQGKVPFPSVRINADTLIDLFPVPEAGTNIPASQTEHLNHFCMVIAKTEMQQVMAHLAAHGVSIDEGPVTRWGAHGNGTSIYFCDPEGRRIELRYYDA